MPTTTVTLGTLGRKGLLKKVELYSKKVPRYADRIVGDNSFNDKQTYSTFAATTSLSPATAVDETHAIGFDSTRVARTKQVNVRMFGRGVAITKQAKEVDLYNEVSKYPKLLARAMMHAEEYALADVFTHAFDTAGSFLGWDSVGLCSTAHPTDAGTQANTSTAATPLDAGSLQMAQNSLMATLDEKGLVDMRVGTRLIVAPYNATLAERLTKSTRLAETGDNDMNPSQGIGVLVNPYHSAPNAWFLQDTENHGLFKLGRCALAVEDDFDIVHQLHRIVISKEFLYDFLDWRGIWGEDGE